MRWPSEGLACWRRAAASIASAWEMLAARSAGGVGVLINSAVAAVHEVRLPHHDTRGSDRDVRRSLRAPEERHHRQRTVTAIVWFLRTT